MIGAIVKGKDMDEHIRSVVRTTLGHYSRDDRYFLARTPMGLLVFDIA